MKAKLTFLGTGTSQGVPIIGCGCEVCRSTDSRDKRFRSSALVEYGGLKILVDAGPDFRSQMLREGVNHLDAILLTHDHLDHIRSLGSFCKHLCKPVWATEQLHKSLSRHFMTHEYISGCRNVLAENKWNEVVEGKIKVRYFVVPHDATQTVGFAICIGDTHYVHITDCGGMTQEAVQFCSQADSVVLESNYDRQMLLNGPYTQELKTRILNGNGHLSNDDCASAIKSFMHPGLKNLFLCHLSENNNTPELAYESAKTAISDNSNIRLQTLPRRTPSSLIIL